MYDKIKQIFSPNNPSNALQNGFDGDMMLPFVNQRVMSVGKEMKTRKPNKDTPTKEKKESLNVVSSKVTLEEKTAALDSLLARIGSDQGVDMGTNTTPLEQSMMNSLQAIEKEKESVLKNMETEDNSVKPLVEEPAKQPLQQPQMKVHTLQIGTQSLEDTMTELNMPKSFLKAGQIKKYQMRSRKVQSPEDNLDGCYLSHLLQPNLQTNREIFKNKNIEIRKNVLRRRELPRRDSEENLSFWTSNTKRKFNE